MNKKKKRNNYKTQSILYWILFFGSNKNKFCKNFNLHILTSDFAYEISFFYLIKKFFSIFLRLNTSYYATVFLNCIYVYHHMFSLTYLDFYFKIQVSLNRNLNLLEWMHNLIIMHIRHIKIIIFFVRSKFLVHFLKTYSK